LLSIGFSLDFAETVTVFILLILLIGLYILVSFTDSGTTILFSDVGLTNNLLKKFIISLSIPPCLFLIAESNFF
jgi:hypothetical protein